MGDTPVLGQKARQGGWARETALAPTAQDAPAPPREAAAPPRPEAEAKPAPATDPPARVMVDVRRQGG